MLPWYELLLPTPNLLDAHSRYKVAEAEAGMKRIMP